jgi:aryl-alcohol dehydrogenase-like predicted oxidoreductase
MQYRYLEKTGLSVSRLCLGTMMFGGQTNEADSIAIMDYAFDKGINFFDTANFYGGEGHRGWVEEMIGRWFAQGGNRREKVVLATKVFHLMEDTNDGPNEGRFLSLYKIRRHLEGSLRRLQTDHIELYQMHHIDPNLTWEECWGAFEPLVNQGKVDYIGSSNFAARYLCYAQAAAAKRNFLGLVSEQHKYNLNCRLPELELLPTAKELGLGVIVWSPLDAALLSGTVLNPAPGSKGEQRAKNLSGKERAQLTEYTKLCKELGESEANVALAWILTNPAITAPIIGPRTLEQFENTLRAVEIQLSEEVLKKLDEIFPGPGVAPQAYAW